MTTHNLTFAVSMQPEQAGLPRRFSGVAYSGGVIPDYGWNGDAAIDLATLQTGGEIFALVDHNPTMRAGKLRARCEAGQLLVDGEFFTSTEAGREVAATFAEGAPWQMSVGIQASVEGSEKPRPVELNGQSLTVNSIFRNASLREVSFVPVGADPSTSVSAFAKQSTEGAPKMELEKLQQQVAELTAKLAAVQAERDASNEAIQLAATVQRKAELVLLFAEKPLSAEAETIYLSLSAAQFAAVKAELSKKPHIPDSLTTELANGDADDSSQDPRQISMKAVALIDAQAKQGITLGVSEAVNIVTKGITHE
jgi:phage head maturation protease